MSVDAADEGQGPSLNSNQKKEESGPTVNTSRRNRSQVAGAGSKGAEESKETGQKPNIGVTRRRSGLQKESRGQARNSVLAPGGTRPPMIPTGKIQDKENIRDQQQQQAHKDYGKVPKYLQKFNK